MLNKLKKSKLNQSNHGFTIIEVMIVLAIAALILLIVLLAVPALQRSSRNTQRKNDVSAAAAAVANYISDNNGEIPDNISTPSGGSSTVACLSGGANGASCTEGENTEAAKVGFYTTIITDTSASSGDTAHDAMGGDNTNELVYVPGFSCNTANTGLGDANPRTASFLYQLESGGTSNQCTEQ